MGLPATHVIAAMSRTSCGAMRKIACVPGPQIADEKSRRSRGVLETASNHTN